MSDGRRRLLALSMVVAVALAAVAGWFAVVDRGDDLALHVDAGASLEHTPSNATGKPGTVTVAFTSNPPEPDERGLFGGQEARHADYLTVTWRVAGRGSEAGRPTGAVAVTAGSWRLAAVGQSVTLAERTARNATTLRVTVLAHRNDASQVVVDQRVTI